MKGGYHLLGICAVLFGVSVLIRGEPVMNAFLFSVALALAAIPEALSSIVTVVLAFGTRQMARENAVIRRLQAVEGLGSVEVVSLTVDQLGCILGLSTGSLLANQLLRAVRAMRKG